MSDEQSSPSSQLSIIVDLISSPFDIKSLYTHLPSSIALNTDHHYWHFGGLRSYTTPIQSNHDQTTIDNIISKLKSLQNPPTSLPPFWICHKKCQEEETTSTEIIKKNLKLGRFYTNNTFQIEYTSGALVQLDKYLYDTDSEIKDGCRFVFYYDRIDFDYGTKENKLRKTLKAQMMDKCSILMTSEQSFTIFINLTGNPIEYQGRTLTNDNEQEKSSESTISYIRTAPKTSQLSYSTIGLHISLVNDNEFNEDHQKRLSYCLKQFREFFLRNHINECYGLIQTIPSKKDASTILSSFMNNTTNTNMSFIKNYCWHMLLSIGYRFQQRLTEGFKQHLNLIEDDDEFYQTSLHIWRRANEYYFIDLLAEFYSYQEKSRAGALSTSSSSINYKKEDNETERCSIYKPPKNYAYVPSVTLTPTTICVKPLKLVKTNRVLRETNFGGHLMFALVDVKDENSTTDLFPHDYRALRWKIEMLLEYGFDLSQVGRTYRYLHHSQSQLKDKQFWFYHHDGRTNFSFEEAFTWMGDFSEEKIIAKHAARIAQCFTSAEATIQIPMDEVEYIKDIETDDSKYNFTDGVGTMSTAIRDKINPHRQFSAIQIRYGGCKGVISVNPELDNSPHQLRIRNSMKKFKCAHDILELCRVSKPRPLYLNRQIIILLSHRKIDDRRFLLLQNENQQILSESLVYPHRAHELLGEKLNRNLFPLQKLINDAKLNLIQEPFFRQLLITIGKFELIQMKERTRLKLPKNLARNMIGIVDEYGILEYGQVFIQYTELNGEYINNNEPEKTTILQQPVVVTKNPCYHPGDIRVFQAVDVPRLRHLKDVIVFPQRGNRPHPNEISGSDLDGDEYAVIWHPSFIPKTANDNPYDYESRPPMLRVVNRNVNRADIQKTVLDISEQSCVGKLCSIHLATMDLYGVAHPKTLQIASYISEELDASKTGQHPLKPEEVMQLQADLGNKRPDYFDKPYYKLYPSEHVLGQLFRSALRFEPNWITIQTPPTTINSYSTDPLLMHDYYHEYRSSVEELARVYRESIMDIMYVYHFSSDVDLFCRFDSSTPQHRTPLTKQQTESACIVADSAQVELKQLIQRIQKLFFDDIKLCGKCVAHRPHLNCYTCMAKIMAKASALYIYCYTDTHHARHMLSLPWLFARYLIELRKLNIKKLTKYLTPEKITQKLEMQPYSFIGQSLQHALQYIIDKKQSFYFQSIYSLGNRMKITVSLRPALSQKGRLLRKKEISLMDYILIEILHHYVCDYLSTVRSAVKDSKPNLLESVWQHILTRFVLNECSPLILSTIPTTKPIDSTILTTIQDPQFWSDEEACVTLQRFIDISIQCADHGPEPTDYAHANEYLVLALQKMATTGTLFSS